MSKSNGFVVNPATPRNLRVYIGEGDRLPGSPDRQQLHKACTIGARVGASTLNRRVKCPSRVGPLGKRWTTLEAWNWYDAQLNGDE